MLHGLDLSLFYALYPLSYGPLSIVVDLVAEKFLYIVLGIFVYLVFQAWQKGEWQKVYTYGVALLSAVLARGVVTEVIRYFYHRPRPYVALDLWPLFQDAAYSFPSGHTIFIFALATGVWFVHRPVAYLLATLGLLIGLARVAAGVHYPSDVLGGAVLGIAVGYLVHWVYKKLTI